MGYAAWLDGQSKAARDAANLLLVSSLPDSFQYLFIHLDDVA
jgi:hypothetical protein